MMYITILYLVKNNMIDMRKKTGKSNRISLVFLYKLYGHYYILV